MRILGWAAGALGVCIGQAGAGTLSLLSDDGSGSVTLSPGETVNINIVLETEPVDLGFAYATVFLDDNDDLAAGPLSVTDVVAGLSGPDVVYDRDDFDLPADISYDQENEYGLLMGLVDGSTFGPGTYILDTLVVTHTGDETSATVELMFEMSKRSPWVDLQVCKWLPPPCIYLDLGVGSADNPFIINLIPAPPCDGDANGDGLVDPLDSGFVLARFGCEVDAGEPECDAADQNDDGAVDPLDVGYVTARFGACE